MLLFLLAAPAFGAKGRETPGNRKLTFHFNSTPIANLVWQLDSMAGFTQGDGHAFRRLWREKLHWTASDEDRLKRWTVYGRKYRKQIFHPVTSASFPLNCPTPYRGKGGVLRNQRVRLAALNATDLQDYQRRLLRVMPSRDAVEMGLLVAYFEPRFNEWWASSGAKAAAEMTRNLKEAVYEHAMVDLAQQIALFTEAQIEPGHALYFNLMVRPHQYGSGVAGTQIQNHMIAEMSLKDPAGMRLSLLMHELTHHFYDIAPVSRHTALLDSFINAPEPSALGLYTYLNEALATAVGLLVDHRIHTPRAFVQHVADDRRVSLDPVAARLALGLYGVIEKHMRQRRTLFEGFAPLYLSASYRALGERARGPQLELASRTVIARNPRAVPALTEFANRVRAITTLSGRKALLDYPQLSAVIFLMTGELNWLLRNSGIIPSELRSELRTASKENAAFVYALRRSEKANVYIFIGDDEHALVAAQRAFSASDEPFSGLRFATRRTTATN